MTDKKAHPNNAFCGRQTARGVLEEKIKRAEKGLVSLRVLLSSIPWDSLPKEDEESLWGYFIRK